MKNILTPILFTFVFLCIHAQPENESIRSLAEPELKPFYHGVASGDPTSNSVIIWTRVTPDITGDIEVQWRISKDTSFSDTLQQGVFTTNEDRDYTVKIDVQNLDPETFYYYEFSALNKNSLIGRTKTAPSQVSSIDQLRFAIVSCSNYPSGYFTVYENINKRNDIDAVLHLGDYIYEYGDNSLLSGPRINVPDREIIELADYRLRHATQKLDEHSRSMHQNYPIIATWDDHESANNSWREGAENHESNEGDWSVRKAVSQKAYYEWMPIRIPDQQNLDRIWRKLSYGNLADIYVLDTRLYDRDEQDSDYDRPNKRLLGPEQMTWLQTEMANSTAKWQILAQQVMMLPLVLADYNSEEVILTINSDQWDGYTAERENLFNFIQTNNVDNVIVLTGDIHTSWASDLPADIFNYNKWTGEGSVAVEFVSTSVTSTSSPLPLPPVYDIIRTIMPYIKYVDLSRKGYTLLDLDQDRAQADFWTVNRINQPSSPQAYQTSRFTLDGENHLQRDTVPSQDNRNIAALAPITPRENAGTVTGISNNVQGDILNIYPNPFSNVIVIELHLFESDIINLSIVDTKGSALFNKSYGQMPVGRALLQLEDLDLPKGIYEVIIQVGNGSIKRSIVKQ